MNIKCKYFLFSGRYAEFSAALTVSQKGFCFLVRRASVAGSEAKELGVASVGGLDSFLFFSFIVCLLVVSIATSQSGCI